MDKYEYKLRLEEIRTLNKKGRFQEAAQVADTIDWNKVRNVSTLGVVSDVYKINRRFDDAKAILLLANEKSPQNRRILYALCDLTVKMGLVVDAVEYYKEFVQLAPNDNSKYILLYKIYEAQDISLEERIAVLKEYKKREYNEKWAYELAFLYHRVGLATECVEECDQLILWFGEGKYVAKAMELKMLYVPLSPAQQQIYDRYLGRLEGKPAGKAEEKAQPAASARERESAAAGEEMDIQVKPMDMGQYNTMNLQAALAESMKEVLAEGGTEGPEMRPDGASAAPEPGAGSGAEEVPGSVTRTIETERIREAARALRPAEPQAESPASLSQEEGKGLSGSGEAPADAVSAAPATAAPQVFEPAAPASAAGTYGEPAAPKAVLPASAAAAPRASAEREPAPAPGRQDEESTPGERRITGQMSLEEVLAEWEKLKRDNEEKRKRETRQWMMQQTGTLFEDFDHTAKDGVLEKLEREESFDPLDEVEELEEIEAPEEGAAQPDAIHMPVRQERPQPVSARPESSRAVQEAGQVQPAPANAAARVAMAAQGILEETRVPAQPATAAPGVPQVPAASEERAADVREEGAQPLPASGEPAPAARQEAKPAEEAAPAPAVREEPSGREAVMEESADAPASRKENGGDTAALHTRIREQQMEEHERSLTKKEKALFAPFVPTKKAMRQLVRAMDQLSLSAYTGNMIVTGAPGSDMMKFTKNVIRILQASDGNFSGKVAKVNAEMLNRKKADGILAKIPGGALIVERAGKLSDAGTENLMKALNQEHTGAIVFLMDTSRAIGRLTDRCPQLLPFFTARFDIAALDSGTLVKYGCQYAYNMEYSIDELGRLALHTRIEDMQTSDHAVTVEEVREIVDEAIDHAERKSLRHFMDVLLRKRYDEDDMIILRERDFI